MNKCLEQFRQVFHTSIELPVQWGDMDAFNHVNNVIYLRYLESARLALFENTSIMTGMSVHGIGPILAEQSCKYRLPVTYPDTLLIGTYVEEIFEYSFTQYYEIYSHNQQAITTKGTSRVTMVDVSTGQKSLITDALKAELKLLKRGDENA